MVDVFISYSRANQDVVRRLAEAVTRLGYVVWWDEELPVHLSYGDVITDKIGEAKAMLVVWSADSAASEWVRAEADLARNQKKLIQTAIGDCTPPLPFNQIQYADIGDWGGEEDHPGWRKARASIAALCGPAPAGEAAPVTAEAAAPAAPEAAAQEPVAPEPVAPPIAVAPVPVAPVPVAPVVRSRPRVSRVNRLAGIAIAASLLVILTVGGLAFFKGPPSARATAQAAPAPAVQPAALAGPVAAKSVPAVAQPAESEGPEAVVVAEEGGADADAGEADAGEAAY